MYEQEHTAEHIFMRALQNLGKDILVRKVEHREVSKAYVECNNLTLDDVYRAECITNNIIDEARDVSEHTFSSLDEAKRIFPNLRAYEERLANEIRVVEIANYDHAACIKEHVKNTRECEFFIVKHLSRERNKYEIEFLAGRGAKMVALEFGITCLQLLNDLQVSMKTLDATIKNMKRDLELYKRSIVALSNKIFDSISAEMVNGVRFYKAKFEMLDDKVLMRRVGELIGDDFIALISNKKADRCIIILASNIINCSSILADIEKVGGKGGGKDTFATGSIPSSKEDECFAILEENIKTQIYKRY